MVNFLWAFIMKISFMVPIPLLARNLRLRAVTILRDHHYLLGCVVWGYLGSARPRGLRGEELGGADVHDTRDNIVVAIGICLLLYICRCLIAQILLAWRLAIYQRMKNWLCPSLRGGLGQRWFNVTKACLTIGRLYCGWGENWRHNITVRAASLFRPLSRSIFGVIELKSLNNELAAGADHLLIVCLILLLNLLNLGWWLGLTSLIIT